MQGTLAARSPKPEARTSIARLEATAAVATIRSEAMLELIAALRSELTEARADRAALAGVLESTQQQLEAERANHTAELRELAAQQETVAEVRAKVSQTE